MGTCLGVLGMNIIPLALGVLALTPPPIIGVGNDVKPSSGLTRFDDNAGGG